VPAASLCGEVVVGGGAAGAVGTGDDLEAVSVGVVEVDAAAAVPGVDLVRLVVVGVGPVGQCWLRMRAKMLWNSVSVTRKA
jgi:hypothetical protein